MGRLPARPGVGPRPCSRWWRRARVGAPRHVTLPGKPPTVAPRARCCPPSPRAPGSGVSSRRLRPGRRSSAPLRRSWASSTPRGASCSTPGAQAARITAGWSAGHGVSSCISGGGRGGGVCHRHGAGQDVAGAHSPVRRTEAHLARARLPGGGGGSRHSPTVAPRRVARSPVGGNGACDAARGGPWQAGPAPRVGVFPGTLGVHHGRLHWAGPGARLPALCVRLRAPRDGCIESVKYQYWAWFVRD